MLDLVDTIRDVFPANRVAAIAAFLTGLGGQITALAGAFQGNEFAEGAVVVAGFLTQLGTVLTFLRGSQKYDAMIDRRIREETRR